MLLSRFQVRERRVDALVFFGWVRGRERLDGALVVGKWEEENTDKEGAAEGVTFLHELFVTGVTPPSIVATGVSEAG